MLREKWKPLQDPKRDSLLHTGRVLLFSLPQLPLWVCGTEDRGGGRRHTHWRGGEIGCLPEPCRAPQGEETPLYCAAGEGHSAVVEQLLAAGAAVDAKSEVRGELGADRGGLGVEHSSSCPLDFLVLCFSNYGFKLASRISKGMSHVTTV